MSSVSDRFGKMKTPQTLHPSSFGYLKLSVESFDVSSDLLLEQIHV